ncbi:hypothetical protein CC79DRAFT_1276231 [Sarocladium strictum]
MNDDDDANAPSLLQSVLALFAGKRPPQRPAKPASLQSRKREAWLRADSFMQYDDLREADPSSVKRTLRAFEHLVQEDEEIDFNFEEHRNERYPNLRRIVENPSRNPNANLAASSRVRKRGRDCDDAIQALSQLEQDRKKRRVLPSEETRESTLDDPSRLDSAVLMRRHLVSLDHALRRHWVCVCHKCSGLSVRLSLPHHKKATNLESEANFEVFFGVRSMPAGILQEARITVKDLHNSLFRRSSDSVLSSPPALAHHILCNSITESIGQRNCLHFALEDGVFQRLRPQQKTFGSERVSSTVSLSALFQHQQELPGGKSVLPFKGKAVLATTLASALLPFLETPWLQFSFNHSKIQFFEPRQNGELPDITKPFLALEHVPVMPTRSTTDTGDAMKHVFHPNASVLALGILLCELHFCTPVEQMAKETPTAGDCSARNINDDCYTCLDKLQILEDDAGIDYYLATKACLTGEYYPIGEQLEFNDVSVQRLFYQNVVKRLENVIFKAWGIRLGDLGSFDAVKNESCWGPIGREFVRLHTGPIDAPMANDALARGIRHSSMSDGERVSLPSVHSDMVLRLSGQASPEVHAKGRLTQPPNKSLQFFDASPSMGPEPEALNPLSEGWMDNLLSSISHYVDPVVDPVEPVRIAILDSGLDPTSPFLIEDQQQVNPQVKEARSFIHGTQPHQTQDEIGHGTHALGLLLKVAPSAEIYVARVARRETLNTNTFNDITKAIDHAVKEWKVDVISMSFGIREYHEPMSNAIANALNERTLLFAAASNDGANLDRAFPAQYPGVFCIHSTDGNGNPSDFNPTASEKDVNYSLLGHHVSSHWPIGMQGYPNPIRSLSGTSVATPIAAGLAASVLSFVRRQDRRVAIESEQLGQWLKRDNSMDMVFNSMARRRRGAGYDYITPETLFDRDSTGEDVYRKIRDIKRTMYRYQK